MSTIPLVHQVGAMLYQSGYERGVRDGELGNEPNVTIDSKGTVFVYGEPRNYAITESQQGYVDGYRSITIAE